MHLANEREKVKSRKSRNCDSNEEQKERGPGLTWRSDEGPPPARTQTGNTAAQGGADEGSWCGTRSDPKELAFRRLQRKYFGEEGLSTH